MPMMIERLKKMPRWCVVVLVWLGFSAYKAYDTWAGYAFNLYTDPDSLMRLQQIRDLIAGQGWFDLHQYRMGLAGGTLIHWSRLADLGPLLLMLIARPFAGVVPSEFFAMTAYPLLLLLAMMMSAVALARRIGGTETMVPVLVALVASMNVHIAYVPGNIDHHNLQLIAVLWAVYGACGGGTRRDAIITGAAVTVTIIIGMETLPYTLALLLAIGIRWLINPLREKTYCAALGVTLVASTALAALIFMPRPWPWQYCDSFTPATAFLSMAIGLIFIGLGLATDRLATMAQRLVAALVAACLLAAAMVVWFPACIHNAYPTDPIMVKYMFSQITEMEPVAGMIRHGSTESILYLSMAPVVLGVTAYKVFKAHDNWQRWLTICLPVLATLGITLWQVRAQFFLNGLVIPMAAALIAEWRKSGTIKRLAGWLLFTPPLYYMLSIGLATMLHTKDLGHGKLGGSCNTVAALKMLDRLPAGLVLAPLNSGPMLVVHTHHSVLSGTYHRDRLGNIAALEAFTLSDDKALPIIKQAHVDYVVLCPKAGDMHMMLREAPNGLMAHLAKSKTPLWLKRQAGFPNDMQVYKTTL